MGLKEIQGNRKLDENPGHLCQPKSTQTWRPWNGNSLSLFGSGADTGLSELEGKLCRPLQGESQGGRHSSAIRGQSWWLCHTGTSEGRSRKRNNANLGSFHCCPLLRNSEYSTNGLACITHDKCTGVGGASYLR